MAVLTALVGAATAEKLVLGAWVVLLPAALWYAVTGVRRGAGWLAVLALPLTFGLILQLGFYSFCFGTLLFLIVAGYHARHRDRLDGRQLVALAVLLTLTYAAHAFVFLIAGLLLVVLEGWAWAVDGPRSARALAVRLGRVLAASLPALALIGAAAVASGGRTAGAAGAADGPAIALQLRSFLEAALWILPLAVFDHREAAPALLVSLLVFGLGVIALLARRGSRPLRRVDGYLAFVALLLVGILLVPDSTTLGAGGPGAFVTSRLAEFVPLATVLWLAAFPFGSRARIATIAVAGVAAVLLIGVRWSWYQRLSDQAAAFASLAPCVAEGATMAQVNLSRFELPSNRTDQIENETGRLSAPTGGLDLGDAELGDGVHLVRYRADIDPYRHLRGPGGLPETVDPVIDPDRYAATTGGSLDYVLVFGRPDALPVAVLEFGAVAAAREPAADVLPPGGRRGRRAPGAVRAARDRRGRGGRGTTGRLERLRGDRRRLSRHRSRRARSGRRRWPRRAMLPAWRTSRLPGTPRPGGPRFPGCSHRSRLGRSRSGTGSCRPGTTRSWRSTASSRTGSSPTRRPAREAASG